MLTLYNYIFFQTSALDYSVVANQ